MVINPETILTRRTIRDPAGSKNQGVMQTEGKDPQGKCKDRRSLPRRARCPRRAHMPGMKHVHSPECLPSCVHCRKEKWGSNSRGGTLSGRAGQSSSTHKPKAERNGRPAEIWAQRALLTGQLWVEPRSSPWVISMSPKEVWAGCGASKGQGKGLR